MSRRSSAPSAIPIWQLSAGLDALLAWLVLGLADLALQRHKHRGLTEQNAIKLLLSAIGVLQVVLSLYAVAIILYTVATLYPTFALPPIGTDLLPPGMLEWIGGLLIPASL